MVSQKLKSIQQLLLMISLLVDSTVNIENIITQQKQGESLHLSSRWPLI